MRIKIRQHGASVPTAEGWSEMGDWLAELGDDRQAKPPGDGQVEPDGTDDPGPEAVAQVDAQAAPTPAAVMTPAQEARPERLAISPGRAPAELSAAAQHNRPRPLEVAQCALCGIALPLGLMVPDGGQACADIRWYCKDAMACTTRWTSARLPGRAQLPAAPYDAFAGAGEAAPDGAPAERLGSIFRPAQSAV